jgi:hypothetical protein
MGAGVGKLADRRRPIIGAGARAAARLFTGATDEIVWLGSNA